MTREAETQAVLEFGEERHGHLPGCLLNLGTFRAGTLPPVIPDRASMGMNIVYDIEEAREAEERTGVWGGRLVWDALNGAVRRAESDDEWLREHPSSIEWVKDLVPYEVEESDRVVAGMASAARDVIGREPTVSKMVAWTDSCWLHVLSDTPVVVFGPGDAETIHGPNEHVQIVDLIAAAKALALYLYRELRTFG